MSLTYTDYNCGYDDCLTAVQDTISDIPAADVAEVRHGEWIEDAYGYFHCSECGYEHDSPEHITPYCPHCGAKMDEEE